MKAIKTIELLHLMSGTVFNGVSLIVQAFEH